MTTRICKCGGGGCFRCQCDNCGKRNDRAERSNLCSQCGHGYQARIARDPEQRPIGMPDPRR